MMWDHGWWWTGFGALHMLFFWALIILVILALLKWLRSSPDASRASGGGKALDILQERYARGEIDREEYLQRKKDLEG